MVCAVILSFTEHEVAEFEVLGFNVRDDIIRHYRRCADDLRRTGWDAVAALEGSPEPLKHVASRHIFNLYSEAAAAIDEAIEALGHGVGPAAGAASAWKGRTPENANRKTRIR